MGTKEFTTMKSSTTSTTYTILFGEMHVCTILCPIHLDDHDLLLVLQCLCWSEEDVFLSRCDNPFRWLPDERKCSMLWRVTHTCILDSLDARDPHVEIFVISSKLAFLLARTALTWIISLWITALYQMWHQVCVTFGPCASLCLTWYYGSTTWRRFPSWKAIIFSQYHDRAFDGIHILHRYDIIFPYVVDHSSGLQCIRSRVLCFIVSHAPSFPQSVYNHAFDS